jgi:hypothetical protein
MGYIHPRIRPYLLAQNEVKEHFSHIHVRLVVTWEKASQCVVDHRQAEMGSVQAIVQPARCAIVYHAYVFVLLRDTEIMRQANNLIIFDVLS